MGKLEQGVINFDEEPTEEQLKMKPSPNVRVKVIDQAVLDRIEKKMKEEKEMSKEVVDIPKFIVMEPDTIYSPLFWDEEGAAIGDYDSFLIGDKEYSTSSIEGIKEWFLQADKYDPYTDIAEFTTEGMEEWINQGYEYAKQIRAMIPKEIKLYYGYWHQFGDGQWCCCKAYIAPEFERKYMFQVDLIHLETYYEDWYEDFPVSLTKSEFRELCDAHKKWHQTEEYKKWPDDGDEEYFIRKYCPSIHMKVREALKQFALNRWGEGILKELFNVDIYVPEEVWYINEHTRIPESVP